MATEATSCAKKGCTTRATWTCHFALLPLGYDVCDDHRAETMTILRDSARQFGMDLVEAEKHFQWERLR